MAVAAPRPSAARVSYPARKMPGLSSVPILHDISSDVDEEEDVWVDGSSGDSVVLVRVKMTTTMMIMKVQMMFSVRSLKS
jgi:hypothetical protein